MKRCFWLLLAVLFLCGCAKDPAGPTSDILAQKVPLDDLGCFYDTGVTWVNGYNDPRLYRYKEDILILVAVRQEAEVYELVLQRISTQTGAAVCQIKLPSTAPNGQVQVVGENICLTVPKEGKLWILNGDLQIQNEQTLPEQGSHYLLSPGLDSMYRFSLAGGIEQLDLSGQLIKQILPGECHVSVLSTGSDSVLFTYYSDIDAQTGKTAVFDLGTGQVTLVSAPSYAEYYSGENGAWLAYGKNTQQINKQTYVLGKPDGTLLRFYTPDSLASLTDQGHIFVAYSDTGRYALYDLEGKCLARLKLEQAQQEYVGTVTSLLWDQERNGYFAILNCKEPRENQSKTGQHDCLAFIALDPNIEGDRLLLNLYEESSTEN